MDSRILVTYAASAMFTQTTIDYVEALARLGGPIEFLNVTNVTQIEVDLNDYDVVIHTYSARLCFENYVSEIYLAALREFRGLKILTVQDEYNNTNLLKQHIRQIGFDIVLTCVPREFIEYVYPKSEFPETRFETVLTGYVPEDLLSKVPPGPPLIERPIVIGYRGRDIGGFYGRLGYEKYEIGRRMKEICEARGIPHDIATDEESRIYGLAWFEFVGSCRAMLGTESGSNVFDFDGSLQRTFDALAAEKGHRPSYEEFRPYVEHLEDKISMGQISPRVFECAIMRTPMVLFRGRYSDAIIPGEHYIALEKDFSNVDDVLRQLDDLEALQDMADRAFEHLVGSGRFSYSSFVSRIRRLIEAELPKKAGAEMNDALRSVIDRRADDEQWLVSVPTPRPLGFNWFNISHKRSHFVLCRNEVARLLPIADQELQRVRAVCEAFTARLEQNPAHPSAAIAEQHLNALREQVSSFDARTSAARQELESMRNEAANYPQLQEQELVALADAYERNLQVYYTEFDLLNKATNHTAEVFTVTFAPTFADRVRRFGEQALPYFVLRVMRAIYRRLQRA